MVENAETRASRHLKAMIEMSPTLVVGDDYFVYRISADGSRKRFTSAKSGDDECFIIHEVLKKLPKGLLLNPYAAPAGPDGQDASVFYDLLCRSLHSQLSLFLGLVSSALASDIKDNTLMLQYTQFIEDGGEKAFTDAVAALVQDHTWVSCMYNIPKQQGVVRIVPLYDKEDKDFVRFVKHKKTRHALYAIFQKLFDHVGAFTGAPFGTVAPASMTARANAFLAAYRAFVPRAYDLYAGVYGDDVVAMLPNMDAFQEAVGAIDDDAPAVRFRKQSVSNVTAMPASSTVMPTMATGVVGGVPMPSIGTTPMNTLGTYNGYPIVPMAPSATNGRVVMPAPYPQYQQLPTMVPPLSMNMYVGTYPVGGAPMSLPMGTAMPGSTGSLF